jgi:hypothetical protein
MGAQERGRDDSRQRAQQEKNRGTFHTRPLGEREASPAGRRNSVSNNCVRDRGQSVVAAVSTATKLGAANPPAKSEQNKRRAMGRDAEMKLPEKDTGRRPMFATKVSRLRSSARRMSGPLALGEALGQLINDAVTAEQLNCSRAFFRRSSRKFHTPSEDEEQTVIWGWGALAPVSEQNGARAPHRHEIFTRSDHSPTPLHSTFSLVLSHSPSQPPRPLKPSRSVRFSRVPRPSLNPFVPHADC